MEPDQQKGNQPTLQTVEPDGWGCLSLLEHRGFHQEFQIWDVELQDLVLVLLCLVFPCCPG